MPTRKELETTKNHNNYIDIILSTFKTWLKDNKIGSNEKNRKSIAQDIFWLYKDSNLTLTDISDIQKMLLEKECIITEGNIWLYLETYFNNPQYVNFFKAIADLSPNGYNKSPNSCCGKYEIMWRLLRPSSIRPGKGDIEDNKLIIEIKGSTDDKSGIRISSAETNGKQYKTICDNVFKDSSIKPNKVGNGGLKGNEVFEIEKKKNKRHYTIEFLKDITNSKKLLRKYFKENKWSYKESEINDMFKEEGVWEQNILHQIIIRNLFISYKEKEKFDKMYIFGDGTNIKVLETEADLVKIKMKEDYFRINQNLPIGWYIE